MNYSQLSAAIQAYTENTDTGFVAQIPVFVKQAEQRINNTVQVANLRQNVTGLMTAGNKYVDCPSDFLSTYSLALYAVATPTATGTAAAFTVVVSSATDIVAGMYVSGTGIAVGAVVSTVVGTTITLTIANTATVSGTVTFQGDYTYLLNRDVNFIREAYPNPLQRAKPKHYAIFGPNSGNENELVFIVGPTPNAAYGMELHYYYYPESIVQSPVATLGTITGGSAYTAGIYFDVPLTGGSGSGARATITVAGGAVTAVTITNGGLQYEVANTLTAAAANIGGTGSGFSVPVASVTNSGGTSWLGDNFDTVLLYGSLVEAYTYMKGEQDMMALYNGKYQEALALLKNLGDAKQRGDAYQDGQVRLPVR